MNFKTKVSELPGYVKLVEKYADNWNHIAYGTALYHSPTNSVVIVPRVLDSDLQQHDYKHISEQIVDIYLPISEECRDIPDAVAKLFADEIEVLNKIIVGYPNDVSVAMLTDGDISECKIEQAYYRTTLNGFQSQHCYEFLYLSNDLVDSTIKKSIAYIVKELIKVQVAIFE